MALLDWVIFGAMYALIVGAVIGTKGHMQSVADFLAAGRGAGRYLLSISAEDHAWTHAWADLSPWAGQTVTLTLPNE